MKRYRFITRFAALILAAGLWTQTGYAQDSSDLEKRLDQLEQEVSVLKRQLEVKKEDEAAKAKDYPVLTANAKDGFSVQSPDKSFKLKIGGYTQAGANFFTDNKKDFSTTDSFLVRTARLTISGTVYNDYDFYLSPEFAGSSVNLPDAYADVHYWPELKLRAGKFKAPFGLERLQSTPNTEFAELGLPSNLGPNRDFGAQLFGDLWGGAVSYAVGAFNGVEDLGAATSASGDANNEKDLAARIFVTPFKYTDWAFLQGLQGGFATTYGHREDVNSALPVYKSPGQVNVFSYGSTVSADGPHVRFSPQLYYSWNSLGILGEYISSDEELVRKSGTDLVRGNFKNTAWQIEGTYLLTGEDATYTGVTPRHPFSLSDGTWGAFELVSRYGELKLDNDIFVRGFANPNQSISGERALAFGLNWYLNKNFKFVLDYERTKFSGGSYIDGVSDDRKDENAILSRFQIVY